ncbi:MAG: CreA family protein [Rhodospirillales bacterium]
MRTLLTAVVAAGMLATTAAQADEIGSVSTVWKMLGPDHRIVVEAFDDPDIANVSCWISRAKTGGVKGAVGLAEDPSYGSVACRQRGPIELSPELRQRLVRETADGGEKVFKTRTSAIFKTLQVSRMFDAGRDTLIYLVWSDKVIEGSPRSGISVVPIAPWGERP